MRLWARNIELTTNLELTENETRMLAYLASFGSKQIAEQICGKLGSQFKREDWERFWDMMRQECSVAEKVFSDTQSVFRGWAKAKREDTARA